MSRPAGTKKPEIHSGSLLRTSFGLAVASLKSLHPHSLGPFGAIFLIERNTLALTEGFEAFVLDGAEVNKDVMPLISFDKTISFSVIEPFHSTFSHLQSPFVDNVMKSVAGALLRSNF